MASVTLTRSWINLVSDPSQAVVCYTANRSDTFSLGSGTSGTSGRYVMFAGGNIRQQLQAGDYRTLPMNVRLISDDDLATLQAWRGQLVCFRDRHGRKVFGTYLDVTVTDFPDGSGHDYTLTLTAIPYSEAV